MNLIKNRLALIEKKEEEDLRFMIRNLLLQSSPAVIQLWPTLWTGLGRNVISSWAVTQSIVYLFLWLGSSMASFYRNTPMLASGIKGMRNQLSFDQNYLVPLSCGGALDAPSACSGVRRRFTAARDEKLSSYDVHQPI